MLGLVDGDEDDGDVGEAAVSAGGGSTSTTSGGSTVTMIGSGVGSPGESAVTTTKGPVAGTVSEFSAMFSGLVR